MKTLEVGKLYEAMDCGYHPIRIVSRTRKMATVHTEDYDGIRTSIEWRCRIHTDADGDEYIVDTSVPKQWRDIFTYSAKYPVEEVGK